MGSRFFEKKISGESMVSKQSMKKILIGFAMLLATIVLTEALEDPIHYCLEVLRAPGVVQLLVAFGLVVLFLVLMEPLMIVSERRGIRLLAETCVLPWLRYFTVKILLVIRQTMNSKYGEARKQLEELVNFLESTVRTKYLLAALRVPTPSHLRLGERYILGGSLLEHIRSKSLQSEIDALKGIGSIIIKGRENDVRTSIENVAGRIVRYGQLRDGIAKSLDISEPHDEVLFYGTTKERYLDLIKDVKSPEQYEIELWASLVPNKPIPIGQKQLKKNVIVPASFYSFILVFGTYMIGHVTVDLLTSPPVRFALAASRESAVVFLVMLIGISILLLYLGISLVKTTRNYLLIGKILKHHAIYTYSDLEASSLGIIKKGLQELGLGDQVCFKGKSIPLPDFIYRSACVFLPENSPRPKPIVFFPNLHTIAIESGVFYHSLEAVASTSLPAQLPGIRQCITEKDLCQLSQKLVESFESLSYATSADRVIETNLAWLYANAIRLKQFDQIELAEVGRLPSYRLSQPPPLSSLRRKIVRQLNKRGQRSR